MASIFEAIDTRLGHRVAVKRLHPHIASRPGAAERFLREGRAAARIRHPNVVQVLALGSEDAPSPYLAMELLEGRDLGDLLAGEGRLGVTDALAILLPVIAAVGAAHDAAVVHRDLKPSNVFIAAGPRGRPWPKVLDFGVSKVLEETGNVSTATDGVVGTAAYMAPEQARAARNASFASDQYSLGVILYQCLTGELPFATAGVYDLLVAIMTAPIAAPGQRVASIPPELDAVVLRAMSRDVDGRFPSVRAFGAALIPFASERDRVAWAAELQEHAAVSSRTGSAGVAPADALATMSPTARDTKASSRWRGRNLRRALSLGAWLSLLMAGGAAITMRESRPTFPAASVPAAPTTPVPPAPPAPPVEGSAVAAAPAEPSASPVTPPSATTLPTPPPVRPRHAPAASASAVPTPPPTPPTPPAPSTSTSTSSAKGDVPVIGDNGAPILP
jgi:serine/threonine-protein kinase